MIAESLNIPKTVVLRILQEDLGKRKLYARFVPHSLTPEQRKARVTSCQDIIALPDADKHFLNKIITGDETYCFACDPETKRQSSEWVGETSPRPKKLKFQRSRIKTMLIIFFDSGVVHDEFVPEGKRVNAEFYKGVMDSFLWAHSAGSSSCVLLSRIFLVAQYGARPQSCKCLPIFDPKNVTTFYHPLYSPDLSPPDYFLFPKLKMNLKGLHFAVVADIQKAVTD